KILSAGISHPTCKKPAKRATARTALYAKCLEIAEQVRARGTKQDKKNCRRKESAARKEPECHREQQRHRTERGVFGEANKDPVGFLVFTIVDLCTQFDRSARHVFSHGNNPYPSGKLCCA